MLFSKIKLDAKFATFGLLVGIAGVASADEVHVAGSTLGRFNAQPFAPTNSLLDLVYSNSTFDNSTVGGSLDLGGNPNPGANFNNLGSFSLGNLNAVYNGNTFNLMISFTSPTIIAGGSSTVFNDQISGTVWNGLGGVFVDFDNTPQVFTFANGTESGSFTMFVNDVSIAPNQSVSLTGHITGSQQAVPEPTAMVGIACGVLAFIKKRRGSKE